jgi:hypothetical protein
VTATVLGVQLWTWVTFAALALGLAAEHALRRRRRARARRCVPACQAGGHCGCVASLRCHGAHRRPDARRRGEEMW